MKGITANIHIMNDSRVEAWQQLEYGMFIHWGLYSEIGGVWKGQPETKGYNEQIQMWANISEEEYLEVAKQFTAEHFNPEEICQLAKDAGMRYIVLTTKHHDGFSMFKTKTTDYNIVDRTPFGKDALKLLAEECQKQGLKLGLYYSLVDWHQGHEFDHNNCNEIPESIDKIIEAQLQELLTNYGPIVELWFDMGAPTLEQSKRFKQIVREYQPKAAVNSRIWNNQGDFRTLGDNEVPSVPLDGAWQTPASIYHSTWGYRSWQERKDLTGKVQELVKSLVKVRANGGNYLLNIGPRGDGSIVEYEADVLKGIGDWLKRHQHACLDSTATLFGMQAWGEVMAKDQELFLYVMNWPEEGKLRLPGLKTDVKQVLEEGTGKPLNWKFDNNDVVITLSSKPHDEILPVVKVELSAKPTLIPNRTVEEKAGEWNIHKQDLSSRHNYKDDGSYFSTKQTIVQLAAYLASQQEGEVTLTVTGKADPKARYRIQIGEHAHVATGENLTNIGPFHLSANEVIPLIIERADPAYKGEDIDLEVDKLNLKRK
ncbi:hypothetical protein J14TS2_41780 [Bacillus sp. J14TS2]|uniref:alpha-L-fucosidase n=1 Tax=Bacillus sp. J14TS2 TaxID=2807188 RepID=UPI001B05F7E4|nr:alpha-L-fucosidase [Bacillus sp. J14TS2]GIN73703.1 hypothetical protein J14TS2_41780 [Bacillus sp. J14TS2]